MSTHGSSNSPGLKPLRSALRDDSDKTPPLSGISKAVQIAEPDVSTAVSPPPLPPLADEPLSRKQFTANIARRLSGRASVTPLPASASSRNSLVSQPSTEAPSSYMSSSPMQMAADDSASGSRLLPVSPSLRPHHHHHHNRRRSIDQASGRLLAQLAEWLQYEKEKKESRKSRRIVRPHGRKTKSPPSDAKPRGGAKGEPREEASSSKPAAVSDDVAVPVLPAPPVAPVAPAQEAKRTRALSTDSASSDMSLDRLQRIIDDGMAAMGIESLAGLAAGGRVAGAGNSSSRRHSRSMRYQPSRTASSDTDYVDGDVFVPGCDAVLDNSKTLKYAVSSSTTTTTTTTADRMTSDTGLPGRREEKERQAWVGFKNEIIRLAHTLRLKGWRKVPLDAGETVTVERLSGALTNAVYVVLPPSEVLPSTAHAKANPGAASAVAIAGTPGSTSFGGEGASSTSASAYAASRRSQPNKLLLRIYGPQVEHLIDRENELSVLRRLARKKIGPRLLGTFANGRFEEFFDASTLTSVQLRDPDTSRQIAKRMRELHDGVELLEVELAAGPNVWRNWDRWLDAVERTITLVDREVRLVLAAQQLAVAAGRSPHPPSVSVADAWKYRGFVCGVEWPKFKAAVNAYRHYVVQHYGGERKIRDHLIFAHNDTQYGNILRIRPSEKSPLLQPGNEHKQLVVIDFEYAAANPPGVEFANHFTEWAYNYHDAVVPHACDIAKYPTPEQQRCFLRAYTEHRPQFPHQSGASTPRFGPLSLPSLPSLSEQPSLLSSSSSSTSMSLPPPTSSASSIAEFMLDARAPPGGWKEEERRNEELAERQLDELMAETRLWRLANSAQWIVWGIVQAKVPGLELTEAEAKSPEAAVDNDANGSDDAEAAVEEDGFDYLAYAQDRALFFWGDCVQMGIVRLEDLPADLRPRIKILEY